jgi:[ribosomal protein S18]-alanine N-acetyltransferase
VTPAMETATAAGTAELAPLRWWHLAEVARLEAQIFGEDCWSPELFWSELAQGGLRYYLLARRDTEIVGYAGLAAWAGESWVQTVAVAEQVRGHGVGRQLMNALLAEARRRGARTCALEVRADNTVAQQLYASLGFRRIGIRRGYYQPSGADALVLQAHVAPSAPADREEQP